MEGVRPGVLYLKEGGREGRREGGREGRREGGREGGGEMWKYTCLIRTVCVERRARTTKQRQSTDTDWKHSIHLSLTGLAQSCSSSLSLLSFIPNPALSSLPSTHIDIVGGASSWLPWNPPRLPGVPVARPLNPLPVVCALQQTVCQACVCVRWGEWVGG